MSNEKPLSKSVFILPFNWNTCENGKVRIYIQRTLEPPVERDVVFWKIVKHPRSRWSDRVKSVVYRHFRQSVVQHFPVGTLFGTTSELHPYVSVVSINHKPENDNGAKFHGKNATCVLYTTWDGTRVRKLNQMAVYDRNSGIVTHFKRLAKRTSPPKHLGRVYEYGHPVHNYARFTPKSMPWRN